MALSDYKGKIGVIIITLALAISVFTGYAINVTTSTSTETQYDYVTDVSGIFDYDKTPTYVNYDVAENYTGYTDCNRVFVQSSTSPTYTNNLSTSSNYYYFVHLIDATKFTDDFIIYTDDYYYYTNDIDLGGGTVEVYEQNNRGGTLIDTYTLTDDGVSVSNSILTIHYIVGTETKTKSIELPSTYYGHLIISSGATPTMSSMVYAYQPTIIGYFNESSSIVYVDNSVSPELLYSAQDLIDNGIATDLNNGVYSVTKTARNYIYIPSTETTVTGGTYDDNQIYPSGYGSGIKYSTTTQPNNYIIGSVTQHNRKTVNTLDQSMITTTLGANSYITIECEDLTQYPYRMYGFSAVDKYVTVANYVASLNLPSGTTDITLTWTQNINTLDSHTIFKFSTLSSKLTSIPDYVDYGSYADALYGWYNSEYDSIYGYASGTNSLTYNITTGMITNLSWMLDKGYSTSSVSLKGSDYGFFFNSGETNYTCYTYWYTDHYSTTRVNGINQGSRINCSYNTNVPTYMDVNKGIKTNARNAHSLVQWKNDYKNGSVSIVFHADNYGESYSNSFTLSTGDKITISHTMLSTSSVTLNSETAVNIGSWTSYLLTIDAQSGDIYVNPIDIFTNYTTFTLFDYTYQIGNIGGNEEITYINYDYSESQWGICVYQTTVFLETYGTVMHDPSLNVSDYFSQSDLRLNFYSFALYGNSMKINGVTYYGDADNNSIKSTGKLYYDNKSYDLQNVYITYDDTKTYLTFVNDDKTVDLGTTTDKTVSFNGYWAFTTSLYEGKEVVVNNYDWNTQVFAIDIQGLAILGIGLIVIGTLIARRFFSESMTGRDYILIAGAVLFLIALLGGIML